MQPPVCLHSTTCNVPCDGLRLTSCPSEAAGAAGIPSIRRITGFLRLWPAEGNHTSLRPSSGKVLGYGALTAPGSMLTNSIRAFLHSTMPPRLLYLAAHSYGLNQERCEVRSAPCLVLQFPEYGVMTLL